MRQRLWILIVALFLLLNYLPYFGEAFFVIDDNSLVSIPQLEHCSITAFLRGLLPPGYHIDYYPLRDLSYMLDVCIYPQNWAGNFGLISRLHNYLLFCSTIFLLFEILLVLHIAPLVALGTSLIFLLNPFFNETYLWISGRKDILSLFFFCLSVLIYLRSQQRPKTLALALLCFAASLLSKASFSLVPSAALFYFLFWKKRPRTEILFLALASLLGIAWALFQSHFYSNINIMTLNYPLPYRLEASLITLAKIGLGSVVDAYNSIDVCNWGEWVGLNSHFVPWAFPVLALLALTLKQTPTPRRILIFLLLLALWIPISGLFFRHRNFYSVRYYIPILLLLAYPLAEILQKKLGEKKRTYFFAGAIAYFCIQSIWSSRVKWESNASLARYSHAQNKTNIANTTFLIQTLLNEKKWARLSPDESREIDSLISSAYNQCLEQTKSLDYSLCTVFRGIVKVEEVKAVLGEVKVEQFLSASEEAWLHFAKNHSQLALEKYLYQQGLRDFMTGKNSHFDQKNAAVPPELFATPSTRLLYWAFLCKANGFDAAKTYWKEMTAKSLVHAHYVWEGIPSMSKEYPNASQLLLRCYEFSIR